MKQYKELLADILLKGTWKEPARENMPETLSLFGTRMEFDMNDGFPLLTTKKMYTKAIIVELLWFLKGGTNIKYLVDNDCNIWNQDAYRWYLKHFDKTHPNSSQNRLTLEEFINSIKNKSHERLNNYQGISKYKLGDLGKVYGYQWRNQNGVDQVLDVINGLQVNKYSRYHIIDGWNKADFKNMALPPCHLLYQFNCRKENGEFVLDLQMYQRSADTFLGVPFNIASASLLLHIFAKLTNMKPGKFIWIGGDTHIYDNHLEQVVEQLSREPLELCNIEINKNIRCFQDVEFLTYKDFEIVDYQSHSRIKAELKTGL